MTRHRPGLRWRFTQTLLLHQEKTRNPTNILSSRMRLEYTTEQKWESRLSLQAFALPTTVYLVCWRDVINNDTPRIRWSGPTRQTARWCTRAPDTRGRTGEKRIRCKSCFPPLYPNCNWSIPRTSRAADGGRRYRLTRAWRYGRSHRSQLRHRRQGWIPRLQSSRLRPAHRVENRRPAGLAPCSSCHEWHSAPPGCPRCSASRSLPLRATRIDRILWPCFSVNHALGYSRRAFLKKPWILKRFT